MKIKKIVELPTFESLRGNNMKAIKTLLAVSVLAATGAANAALITAPASANSTTSLSTYNSTSGTASLSDNGTTLTIDHVGTAIILGGNYTISFHDILTGSVSGGVFTANASGGGSSTGTSCTYNGGGSGNVCGSALASNSFYAQTGSIAIAPGSFGNFTGTYQSPLGATTVNYSVGPVVAPVPVPAAAWLFGSGLLGLAGTARRRGRK